jgi:hypothetical protein
VLAFFPALVQVGLEVVDGAGLVRPLALEQLFGCGGTGIADHGVVAHAELAGDASKAVPSRLQLVDFGVLGAGPVGEPGGALRSRGPRLGRWFRLGSVGLVFSQAGAVPGDRPLHRLDEVVPQVLAIGALGRLGCAFEGAFGIGAGPVAADHFHFGVLAQPVARVLA